MSAPARPRLARKARLVRDRHEGGLVLLYPERGLALGETAAAIAELCDGSRTRASIVDELVARYGAAARDDIARDVASFLDDLSVRGVLEDGRAVDQDRPPPGPRATTARGLRPSSERGDAPRPFTLVAELSYRCALLCPYCSNPTELAAHDGELTTASWRALLDQAEALGVMQVHFTGGEPLVRRDLEELVTHARGLDLYVNLVTSGVPLARPRLEALARAGVDHVQVSIQASDPALADRIAGFEGSHAQKLAVMRWVKELGLPLTMNVVLHRDNLHEVDALVALAEDAGVDRLELANTQYLAWALANRAVLLPTREQLHEAAARAAVHKARLRGRIDVLFVKPDYFGDTPKACMDGWASRFVNVTPDGLVLPCHAAASLPGLAFERFSETSRPLATIWSDNDGLRAYRGDAWMTEPCRSCPQRDQDFGGCRCQAFALTGDARRADPACARSPDHGRIAEALAHAAAPRDREPRYLYRGRNARPG